MAPTQQRDVHRWIAEIAGLTQPDTITWYTGDERERVALEDELVREGKLIALDPVLRPGSFLARTSPDDVARSEACTYICSDTRDAAGPTNNWCAPADMRAQLETVFDGSMRGRTMYVVPFSMGAVGSPFSEYGVEITDSPYVVLSIAVMTRVGHEVRERIEAGAPWVAAVHSAGHPLRDSFGEAVAEQSWPSSGTKYIAHFPDSLEIWSYGSGYGGNAVLPKKCFALRIASTIAREEGWLAEHMLIIRLTDPRGRRFHIAAAFPSACGKTNLAMLRSSRPGWTVETIGDDIAWMRQGDDGRLWAINPEAGLFGVVPGTSALTNPVALETLRRDTIFTNVALTDDGDVWWEGLTSTPPDHLVDWRGADWTPESAATAAHPNARFTVALDRCPSLPDDDVDGGVPIDAILFGGRRATNVPLVVHAQDWTQGVFMGATIASEQTAAAEGTVGTVRRDPFAMLPFCGYNAADHWSHWLDVGERLGERAPAVFQVNWFRKDADGGFLWPGFGENLRVLEWIVGRIDGTADGRTTPIGTVPGPRDLDTVGMALSDDRLEALLRFDAQEWQGECSAIAEFFGRFGTRLPGPLAERLRTTASDIEDALSARAARAA